MLASNNHHDNSGGDNGGNGGGECDDGGVEGGTINHVRQEKSFKIHMDDDNDTSNECMPQSHSQAQPFETEGTKAKSNTKAKSK